MCHILHNQHCFLFLLYLRVPPLGVAWLSLELNGLPHKGGLTDPVSHTLWVYGHVTWLNTLAVEPGWLEAVYQGQQDQTDASMHKACDQLHSNNGHFCFCQAHGLQLVYRKPKPQVPQLVTLWSGGLR